MTKPSSFPMLTVVMGFLACTTWACSSSTPGKSSTDGPSHRTEGGLGGATGKLDGGSATTGGSGGHDASANNDTSTNSDTRPAPDATTIRDASVTGDASTVSDASADSSPSADSSTVDVSISGDANAPVVCTKITVTDVTRWPVSGPSLAKVTGDVIPALGNADPDVWELHLLEHKIKQAPGTYDLSKAPDDDHETAEHEVLVYQDDEAQIYRAVSGQLTLTVNPTPMTGKIKGSLKNARLVEISVDNATGEWTLIPGGGCLTIDALDFDTTTTTTTPGTPCQTAEECGDTDLMICDPAGTGCQPYQCQTLSDCNAGQTCLNQLDNPLKQGGACYTHCTYPNPTACAAGQECEISVAGRAGSCKLQGTGVANGPCAPVLSDISTGCVAGYACVPQRNPDGGTSTNVCRKKCDYWGANPGCETGTFCDANGSVCSSGGENVALGAACKGIPSTPCAPSNGRYQGYCVLGVCEAFCRTTKPADCSGGKVCVDGTLFWTSLVGPSGFGICTAPPTDWTCSPAAYRDGKTCNCECGAWDPDCDVATLPSTCKTPLVCHEIGRSGYCVEP